MPESPSSLRLSATRAEDDATDARAAADALERVRTVLEGRLDGLLDRHTLETWDSRAALRSRMRLQLTCVGTVDRVRGDLADAIGEVRRRADALDVMASDYRRQAYMIEQEEARLAAEAAAAAAAPVAPIIVVPPPVPSPPPFVYTPGGVR